MSLFEDSAYRWRETYFVLFDKQHRPTAAAVHKALHDLGPRLQVQAEQTDAEGGFEAVTVLAPSDAAGMDISYVGGEEVLEHIVELKNEFRDQKLSPEEKAKFDRLLKCNAQLDIYHFQCVGDGEEDDGLDPGSLLLVLSKLAKLCHGVSVDPQSGSLL